MSTAYYALFHCLAACCADTLVGGKGADRDAAAWRQAYRALQHGQTRKRFETAIRRNFPAEVAQFATLFVDMQIQREAADYDPYMRFSKSDVVQSIDSAEDAITQFAKAPAIDRRAFAVYALLPLRTS